MSVATNYLTNILGEDEDAHMALREIPVFHTASEELLDLIYSYGRVFALGEGQELTREGEFDQWVYFIIDGRLDVFLGGEWVDTIASSLVGERCILGESRKATLRAGKGGTSALGVDMALLDALNNASDPEGENFSIYLELLGRIVGEIVQRLAETEFNRMDIAHKYSAYMAADRDAEIVNQLRHNTFADDRGAAFLVYRHLSRHEPVLLAEVRGEDIYRIDTHRLYGLCVEKGHPEVLFRIARDIREANEANGSGNGHAGQVDPSSPKEEPVFSELLNHVSEVLVDHHEQSSFDLRRLSDEHLRPYLTLNEEMEIDLRGLIAFLGSRYGYSGNDLAEVLMTVLQQASDYTSRVNGRLKAMLKELSQIRFLKDLRSEEGVPATNADIFYKATAPEILIPFFSKNILDVHLIHPYLEKMGLPDPRQGKNEEEENGEPLDDGMDSGSNDEGAALVDSLFD